MRPFHVTVSRPDRASRTGRLLPTAVLLLALAGCGHKTSIDGQVTLDGQPLNEGYINFRPSSTAKGPTLGSPIEKGTFALTATDQVPLGTYRVEITAQGRVSEVDHDALGRPLEVDGQILPARYNQQSELTVDFPAERAHHFEFSLTSP